jgi:hypothetical protein
MNNLIPKEVEHLPTKHINGIKRFRNPINSTGFTIELG